METKTNINVSESNRDNLTELFKQLTPENKTKAINKCCELLEEQEAKAKTN